MTLERRFIQLLTGVELGDRRPFKLLTEIKLAGWQPIRRSIRTHNQPRPSASIHRGSADRFRGA